VTVVVGSALDILPDLVRQEPFDAVFIDADKVSTIAMAAGRSRNLRPRWSRDR
jgi:predicted O-methyltransferase YrrM